MILRNELASLGVNPSSLGKSMLVGAGFAFVLISVFLLGVNNPDPSWPHYWMVRPLIIVTMAGGMGAGFMYVMYAIRKKYDWNRVVVFTFSLLAFVVALWLGTVLGLNGTLWN